MTETMMGKTWDNAPVNSNMITTRETETEVSIVPVNFHSNRLLVILVTPPNIAAAPITE